MDLKKILHRLLLLSLTLGASLIIGLLSFGGFYVLWPSLLLASFSFLLSVAYEGEIYLQNIKGALNKLFQPNYLQQELARLFLKDYFPLHRPHNTWPMFFKEYAFALYQLHAFEHPTLNAEKKPSRVEIEEKLTSLEKKFARILSMRSHEAPLLSKEDQALLYYLHYYKDSNHPEGISLLDKYKALLENRQTQFRYTQGFSALTTVFMGIGTIYLLVETFAVIPFLAAIPVAVAPALIIPMAVIAGAAYGLLTYNTITNIIAHDRIRTRFFALHNDLKKNGLTWRNGLMITATATLGSLAIMLTVCTAGTWWTIIKATPPLFRWMRNIPKVVTGVFLPLITSTAALAFNLENSAESLDMIEEASQEKLDLKIQWESFKKRLQQLRQRENWGQLLNPFRLILITTILPLRVVLFLGHLISIGVTADRVPGLSKILSALLGIISEFFEDMHYFVQHKTHQHDLKTLLKERLEENGEHNHDNDLPTRLLKFIASPFYAMSAIWNYAFSRLNTKEHQLNWSDAFQKMHDPLLPIATPVYDIPTMAIPIVEATPIEASSTTEKNAKRVRKEAHPLCIYCAPDFLPQAMPINHRMHEPLSTKAYVVASAETPSRKQKTRTVNNEHAISSMKNASIFSQEDSKSKKSRVARTPIVPIPFNMNMCTVIEPTIKSKPKKLKQTKDNITVPAFTPYSLGSST